ncbi:MAG: Cof-type HAD-IIB family hydrolase [Vagococcus sp.]
MIQLIASDMDGTLLSSKLSVSEGNKQAILEAQKHGVEFMVATGRAYSEAKPPLEEAGINCSMITGNGAQVFDSAGQVLFTVSLEKELVKKVMHTLRDNGLYFELMTTEGVYSESHPQRIENFATHLAENMPHLTYKMAIAMAATYLSTLEVTYIPTYEKLLADDSIEVLKIISFSGKGPDYLESVGEMIQQLGDVYVTSSFPTNIEINHKNAQKGIAVERIATEKGISMEQVMTIGDNYNDVSMLQATGVSFAMGNAEKGVKKIAKYETDTNINDGVGKAILRAISENL